MEKIFTVFLLVALGVIVSLVFLIMEFIWKPSGNQKKIVKIPGFETLLQAKHEFDTTEGFEKYANIVDDLLETLLTDKIQN